MATLRQTSERNQSRHQRADKSGLAWWLVIAALAVDCLVFGLLRSQGVSFGSAQLASIVVAAHLAVLLAWSVSKSFPGGRITIRRGLIVESGLLAIAFLRGNLLSILIYHAGISERVAMPIVSLLACLALWRLAIWGVTWATQNSNKAAHWTAAAFIVSAYLLVLRLVSFGQINLMPEEAYYWNYSQHLSWGYLDHPPMVAWLSALGTALVGHDEFGVRLGAFICWFVAAGFMAALASKMFTRRIAAYVVMLMSILPFFLGVGALMVPDSPLTACWAGALYFLYLALVLNRRRAWWGAGVCLGLGLLSKYTIGLLVPSAGLFLLLDKDARRQLLDIRPYLALVVAGLLFSPVIYWNSQHEWASFAFQTTRRISESFTFSVHALLASILVLLTPIGFYAVTRLLYRWNKFEFVSPSPQVESERLRRFVFVFVLVPLGVFTLFSITHQPKLNWTGPLWLVALPPLAAWIDRQAVAPKAGSIVRLWFGTAIVMTLLFASSLYWLVIGLPGMGYPKSIQFVAGWDDLARQVEPVTQKIYHATGEHPLVTGLDRYFTSSQLAFYDQFDGPTYAAGCHLFGSLGLMYEYWFPASQQEGKTIVVLTKDIRELSKPRVIDKFDSVGSITPVPLTFHGYTIGDYYYRIGWGYKPLDNELH